METLIGSALAASLVLCARRRSTEAIEGDVEDDDIREMVGGTAEGRHGSVLADVVLQT